MTEVWTGRIKCSIMLLGFGEGRQLSEADLTSRGACESLSLDLPRLTTRPPTRS